MTEEVKVDRRENDRLKQHTLRRFYIGAIIAFAILGVSNAIALAGFGIVLSNQSDTAQDIQAQRYDSLITSCKQQNDRHDKTIDSAVRRFGPEKAQNTIVLVDQLQPYVNDCAAQARSRVKGDR